MKGKFKGICYRTVCDNPNAEYYNKSTREFYCESCAEKINAHNIDYFLMNNEQLCIKVFSRIPNDLTYGVEGYEISNYRVPSLTLEIQKTGRELRRKRRKEERCQTLRVLNLAS